MTTAVRNLLRNSESLPKTSARIVCKKGFFRQPGRNPCLSSAIRADQTETRNKTYKRDKL